MFEDSPFLKYVNRRRKIIEMPDANKIFYWILLNWTAYLRYRLKTIKGLRYCKLEKPLDFGLKLLVDDSSVAALIVLLMEHGFVDIYVEHAHSGEQGVTNGDISLPRSCVVDVDHNMSMVGEDEDEKIDDGDILGLDVMDNVDEIRKYSWFR